MKKKNEIAVIEKKVPAFVHEAEKFVITEKTVEKATIFLSNLNKANDTVKAEEEDLTRGIRDTLKKITDRYKKTKDPLKQAIDLLRNKLSAYQTLKIKEADKKSDEIASRVGHGRGKLKAETATRKMSELAPIAKVSTEAGTLKFRTDKVVVIDKRYIVPEKYVKEIVFDERAIKAAFASGEKVPGCHIEEVQVPVNSRN